MIRLGLTGSIGTGKSTTAGFFRAAGVPVWDADAAVHRLYAPGGAAVTPVASLCPAALQDGGIERDALKTWISRDPTALARLEAVVHPLVAADRADFLDRHADAPLVVLDIPLLFETGDPRAFDAVLVVSIDPDTQRRRVLARPGMTEDQFAQILARQMPDDDKRARADHVIETRSLDQTRAEVLSLIEYLTQTGAKGDA
ncbi:MAG: dephospho-CoA kinase [Pseudomonadota bacterium]